MPDWSREVKTLLAGLKIEPIREADITEEISQHLNDRYEELLSQGPVRNRLNTVCGRN